jgi:uncharacterized cupredoxin-like copper-binding protein
MPGLRVTMEGGQSTGGAPTAAPKKGAMWIVIAIVVAVAITAAVMDLAVFPALQPAGSTDFKVHLMTFDVGYDRPNYNPEWQVKAGQVVVVTMNNSGAMAHEFLLFSGDRTAILRSAQWALTLAQSHNPGWDTNSDIANTTLDEYTGYHDSWTNLTRFGCNDPTLGCVDHDVDPDATFLFWFVINTPGTYFFACHQVDITNVPWQIHQDKGMWGTIVVS